MPVRPRALHGQRQRELQAVEHLLLILGPERDRDFELAQAGIGQLDRLL